MNNNITDLQNQIASREIKFRVWDKSEKVFLVHGISKIKDTERWVYRLPNSLAVCSSLEHCINTDQFVVIQFTGLKDKNGNEIYEGDIVIDPDNGGFKSVVFHTGGSDTEFLGSEHGWNTVYNYDNSPEAKQYTDQMTFRHDSNGNNYEVIGNIWESPELLTK